MDEISFLIDLSLEGNERLRVRAIKEKRKIISFMVQFESFLQEKWTPIVRYDTAHGFAHRDIMHPDGSQTKQPLFFQTYNESFTFAIHDLKLFWKNYLGEFKKQTEGNKE